MQVSGFMWVVVKIMVPFWVPIKKLGYTLPSLGNNATANPLDDYS